MSRGVRFAVWRRFTFQTGDTYMLLVKVYATKEAADGAVPALNETWKEILAAKALVSKKAFAVSNIVEELGIGQISHAVLPVDYEEPLVTTDLRSLPKMGH